MSLLLSSLLGGSAVAADDPEADAPISGDGLCALATPQELSGLGALEYDSSTGLEEFCTYSQSDWDAYHATTVGILFGTTLDQWRGVYTPDGELEIGGAAAFSSGPDVFTQAGGDVLQVTVSLPDAPPADVDAVTQAAAISELFLPRLDQLITVELEPDPRPAGPSLCEAMSLRELNTRAGRAFDRAEGGLDYCNWTSSDPGAGLDKVVATVTDLTLDEFRQLLDEVEGGEIDGAMTIRTSNQAVIELPDGRTLDVSVYYDESVRPSLPADALALTVAEWLAPEVAPRVETEPAGGGLLGGRDEVDDICRAVPFEELSSISGVTFEDPIFGGGTCEYHGGDDAAGWHYAVTSLDQLPLWAWLEDDDSEMTSLEIGGQPAALAADPFGDGEGSALAVVAVPGFDELTFSAYIAIDTSTGTKADPLAAVEAMAELGLARLLGSAD